MKIEQVTVLARELKIGDEFWFDKPYRHDYHDQDGSGPLFAYKIVGLPIESSNSQLFWDGLGNMCYVVPVEYADGARGSRLFDPILELTIRRDVEQKRE